MKPWIQESLINHSYVNREAMRRGKWVPARESGLRLHGQTHPSVITVLQIQWTPHSGTVNTNINKKQKLHPLQLLDD